MVKGQFITINGERFYEIANYDEMNPFFISLSSDTDLWMYLSSTGGVTAGRQNPNKALFPYYTDDKITERLSDGRFILLDGGRNLAQDADRLYEYLKAGCTQDRPRIAAWIFPIPIPIISIALSAL